MPKEDQVEKFLNYGKLLVKAYESRPVKEIINLLPNQDSTARKQYSGEKHALLILSNGRYGFANFCGPSTHIIERLKKDDPPRTRTDQVAKLHDINYALSTFEPDKAKQLKDIRDADTLMIRQLEYLKRNQLDNPVNINIGQRLIQSKVALEDVGILDNKQFSGTLNMYPQQDKKLLLDNRNKLLGLNP